MPFDLDTLLFAVFFPLLVVQTWQTPGRLFAGDALSLLAYRVAAVATMCAFLYALLNHTNVYDRLLFVLGVYMPLNVTALVIGFRYRIRDVIRSRLR